MAGVSKANRRLTNFSVWLPYHQKLAVINTNRHPPNRRDMGTFYTCY